jgi:hypothetical protein
MTSICRLMDDLNLQANGGVLRQMEDDLNFSDKWKMT